MGLMMGVVEMIAHRCCWLVATATRFRSTHRRCDLMAMPIDMRWYGYYATDVLSMGDYALFLVVIDTLSIK